MKFKTFIAEREKLDEITTFPVSPGVYDRMIEPNMLLSLQNLNRRQGKGANTGELVFVCQLLQLIALGELALGASPIEDYLPISKPLLDELRKLKPAELHKLTTALLKIVQAPAIVIPIDPVKSAIDWMRYFQAREATD
jgi:hypothetical protein